MDLFEIRRIKAKPGHAQSRIFFDLFLDRIECSLGMPNISIGINSAVKPGMLLDGISLLEEVISFLVSG
jgi:hypothetical protein